MANPLRSIFGGPITIGAAVSGYAVAVAAQSFSTPITRELNYQVNWGVGANMVPDPETTIALWHKGRLNDADLVDLLGYQAVSWDAADGASATKRAWAAVIDLSATGLGASTYADLWRQGYLPDDEYVAQMVRAGISSPRNQQLLLSQTEPFSPPEALQFRNQGLIDDADYQYSLKRAGLSADSQQEPHLAQRPALTLDQLRTGWWIGTIPTASVKRHGDLLGYAGDVPGVAFDPPFAVGGFGRPIDIPTRLYEQISTEEPFDHADTLNLYYRGEIDLLGTRSMLAAAGIVDTDRQDAWMRTRRPIPGPADLSRFAVRDVWDPQVVQRFDYDAEFPVPFQFWMQQIGYGWGADQVVPGVQPGQMTDWPRAYWRAHWAVMSPSQAYECYHRLRPNRIGNFQATVPGVQPFLFQDLLTVLKVADYPTPVRQWLAAVSHSIVDIRMVRLGYQFGLIPRADFVEHALDRGYTPADAELQAAIEDGRAAWLERSAIRRAEQSAPGQVIRAVLCAYGVGAIDRTEAVARFDALEMKPGPASQLLNSADALAACKTIQSALKALRRGWLMGEFAPAELLPRILSTGVTPAAAQRYAAQWTFDRTFVRRQFSTAQILRYVAEGRLGAGDATIRLSNLGWSSPDALVMLASAGHALEVAQGKALAAQDKAASKRAHELEAAQRKLQEAQRKVEADLKKLTPLSQLKKWLTSGIVSESYVYGRMLAMGYPADIINGYLADWGGAKKAEPVTPPPPPPPPPPPLGSGAGAGSLTAATLNLTAGS